MLRNARLFLEDIEKSCTRIVLYTEGRMRDQVFNDGLRLDGILLMETFIGLPSGLTLGVIAGIIVLLRRLASLPPSP